MVIKRHGVTLFKMSQFPFWMNRLSFKWEMFQEMLNEIILISKTLCEMR